MLASAYNIILIFKNSVIVFNAKATRPWYLLFTYHTCIEKAIEKSLNGQRFKRITLQPMLPTIL